MIHLPKTTEAPECLETEKTKANGNYNCGSVLETIKKDFHNKCYICEFKHPTTINTEHFTPHKGTNKDLEFDWKNLFYACGHCNNIKLAKPAYDDILNCTNKEDKVDSKITYWINPYPAERAEFTPNEQATKVINTAHLLDAVFNGTTVQKKIESANLRVHLLKEIRIFQDLLFKYIDDTNTPEETASFKNEIIRHLRPSSNFTAFKLWILRKNEALRGDFAAHLTSISNA